MESLFGDIVINNKKSIAKPRQKQKKSKEIKMSESIDSSALFGDEYKVKEKVKKSKDIKEANEIDAEKALKSKKLSTPEKLAIINAKVLKVLGKQKQNVLVIKDRETLHNYITEAIKAGRIAVDTETNNSLDPITCKLMGLCLYYPEGKQAYIPVNHRDYKTGEKLNWQLTEQDCREELQRILDSKTYVIMHNGKFDLKVILCTCGIEIDPDWDTMIAAKVLNENEFSAGLKQQYIDKIDKTQEKYSIEKLFENIEYADVDPDIFALYAGTDAMMTDKLYLWQKPRLEETKSEPGPNGKTVYDLFTEVEMPCVVSTAKMELNGIRFDKEYATRLKLRFEKELADIDAEITKVMEGYKQEIVKWRADDSNNVETKVYVPENTKMSKDKIELAYPKIDTTTGKRYKMGKSKASQLEDPISLASPTQLAILLYDILKIDNGDDRSTGEEALESIKTQTPLAELLLKRRGIVKLLDAFINSLPENVNPKTGKIHCSFHQYGAATGRFSSSNPNLQQIPSHMKNIRLLFTADPGYKLIGSDFSQQEVRVLAELSKDPSLIDSYKNNKDIYATVASGVYHMDYWDCMEHHEDGSPNPEGKKRRASCKSIVLGIMYSRGAAAIAEQIGSTKERAQEIVDDFYKSFPTVKSWMDDSLKTLKNKEYVEDFYGRRRRLPDVNLDSYRVSLPKASTPDNFNPFLCCNDREYEDPAIAIWNSIVGSSIINSNITQYHNSKGTKELNDEMSNRQYDKIAAIALNSYRSDDDVKKLIKRNNEVFDSLKRGYFSVLGNEKTADGKSKWEREPVSVKLKDYCNQMIEQFGIKELTTIPSTSIVIDAFTGRRSQAERQCVNARIQGSSATMTKIAMNKITKDPELLSYGFKLCIGVHDELIGEVKEEFAEAGAKRLCDIMKTCVSDIMSVPFKCDPSIVFKWYEDELAYQLQDNYKLLIKEGKTEAEAVDIIAKSNSEFLPEEIDHLLHFE